MGILTLYIDAYRHLPPARSLLSVDGFGFDFAVSGWCPADDVRGGGWVSSCPATAFPAHWDKGQYLNIPLHKPGGQLESDHYLYNHTDICSGASPFVWKAFGQYSPTYVTESHC